MKQMKYFGVPLDHAWKVPVLQKLLNTRTNNLYIGFDDYVITEIKICFVMSNDQCRLFVHNFAYFFFFCKIINSKFLNKFKQHHLYMFLCE